MPHLRLRGAALVILASLAGACTPSTHKLFKRRTGCEDHIQHEKTSRSRIEVWGCGKRMYMECHRTGMYGSAYAGKECEYYVVNEGSGTPAGIRTWHEPTTPPSPAPKAGQSGQQEPHLVRGEQGQLRVIATAQVTPYARVQMLGEPEHAADQLLLALRMQGRDCKLVLYAPHTQRALVELDSTVERGQLVARADLLATLTEGKIEGEMCNLRFRANPQGTRIIQGFLDMFADELAHVQAATPGPDDTEAPNASAPPAPEAARP